MPKQTLAQKSVYWLKVISLGLILGLGIQFAQAWTSPTLPPPGGNVSGPITTSATAQYKTGMLGINSTTTPVNALEVGGGGNAYIGGSFFAAGSINAASGAVTGVLTAGKVQIVDVVMENTICLSNGLVAKDSTGMLLSCQGSPLRWKKANVSANWTDITNKPTDISPSGTMCGLFARNGDTGEWDRVLPCKSVWDPSNPPKCPSDYLLVNLPAPYMTCMKN
jgi:hypothetical protein